MITFYIDESGSFVPVDSPGLWNVTAAIAVPGTEKRKCIEALRRIKVASGFKSSDEIKLGDVDESNYAGFIEELCETKCTFFAVTVDSGLISSDSIIRHREGQAQGVVAHVEKMIHPEGKKSLEILADQIRQLSPQLYVQLVCQVELFNELIDRATMYYVQRMPNQLNRFRWEVDEKLGGTSNFEKTFRTVVPPLLQSKSFREPHIHLSYCNYEPMMDYFYTQENRPTYMDEFSDTPITEKLVLNLGKMVWEDFNFMDSKKSDGVQISDLLASGLRRSLRGGFKNNLGVSKLLGRLMVQAVGKKPPIRLVSLAQESPIKDPDTIKVVKAYESMQKQILLLPKKTVV